MSTSNFKIIKMPFLKNIFEKRTISVLAAVEIMIYLIFIIVGLFLFNQWNNIPTRVVSYEIDKIYPEMSKDDIINDSTIRLTDVDIVCQIPMKKQKDVAKIQFSWNTSYKNSTYKTTFINGNLVSIGWSDSLENRIKLLQKEALRDITKDSLGMILYCESVIKSDEWYLENLFKSRYHSDFIDADTKILSNATITPRVKETSISQTIFIPIGWVDRGNISIRGNLGSIIAPGYFHLSDISASYYEFNLNSQRLVDASKLEIDFVSVTDFYTPSILPDSISYHSIIYTDKEKLKELTMNNLKFYAEFPEMRNKQNVRVFILSAIISAIIGFLVTVFIRLMIGKRIDVSNTENQNL